MEEGASWRSILDAPGRHLGGIHLRFSPLAKQSSTVIFKSALLIFIDLGWRWDSIFILLGSLSMPWGSLGPPRGTRKSPWRHPGAPSQPDTKNNPKDNFLVTCFDAQIGRHFSSFPGLAFTCLSDVANVVQMPPKCLEKGSQNYTFQTAALKLRNCVSTAPARADRRSAIPKN